ncbi:hypothetical protein JCM6882_001329 [Rhodosporidiobolus microsporus]
MVSAHPPHPPPFGRTHSTPTFSTSTSSSSSPSPSSSPNPRSSHHHPAPTLHSTLLHALPLPHLLFDPSLRLHSLNDAARTVFGVTSGHGGPSSGGADFPPGGADAFFCVTEEMKRLDKLAGESAGGEGRIKRELERLAERQDEREASGGGGEWGWGWGEGDRVELKSGRVPGLRWAAEAKVTRFVPPPPVVSPFDGGGGGDSAPGSRRSSSTQPQEESDPLPSWLGSKYAFPSAAPSPSESQAWFSILLLRPWKDRPVPVHPAHEKLLNHRRSFSLDTPFAPSQPVFAGGSPFAQPPSGLSSGGGNASPSAVAPPPNFSTFTFPPHNPSPSPSSPSTGGLPQLNTSQPPLLSRRKDSYSSERTPTLGSALGGNPFAWSSLAVRRESLGGGGIGGGGGRRESLGAGLGLGGRRESYSSGMSSGLKTVTNSPAIGAGAGLGAGGGGAQGQAQGSGSGSWEFSRPFGATEEEEGEEGEAEDEGEGAEPPSATAAAPPSRIDFHNPSPFSHPRPHHHPHQHQQHPHTLPQQLQQRRRSGSLSEQGAPSDPGAWPISSVSSSSGASSTSASPPEPEQGDLAPPVPFDAASAAASKPAPLPLPLRLPHGVVAAASAISPRTASGLTGGGGTGSAGSAGSGSSSGGGSARSALSLNSTVASTAATSPSRRGSTAGSGVPNLPVLPEGLTGMGISVSSAGIQLSQSSPVVAPSSGGGAAGGLQTPSLLRGEDMATPTSTAAGGGSVLTPTLANPLLSSSAAPPLPHALPFNRPPYSLNLQPPPSSRLAHPLSLSRSATSTTSSSSNASSPSSSAHAPVPPALLSPRPTALPPIPIKPPAPTPDLPSLLKYATLASLPNCGVIISDSDLSSGYVNGLARELLMGVPASEGVNSPTKDGGAAAGAGGAGVRDEWWNLGAWSVDDEPWSSISASSAGQASTTSSQPFFSPSSDLRANPFEAKDLTFGAIIAAGEASTVERGKGTAGSALRIGRAAESNRYRTTVAGILARSLVNDERRKAALGKSAGAERGGPSPLGMHGGGFGAATAAAAHHNPYAHLHSGGFSTLGALRSPGGVSVSSAASSSGGSVSTTANQTPSFVSGGGVGGQGMKRPYKLYDWSFSQRIVDPLEPLLEMCARRGEEPPPPSGDDSDEDEEGSVGGAVTQGMIVGVEIEVWEAVPGAGTRGGGSSSSAAGSPSSAGPTNPPPFGSTTTTSSVSNSALPSSLKNDSFVTSTSAGAGLFTGRKKRVRRRIVEITAAPIHAPRADGGKQHLGGVIILRDVTNSRRRGGGWGAGGDERSGSGRKAKGKKGEAYYKEILDSMPQLVWKTTPMGSHTYFNRLWYEYTGLEPEQSLGLGWQSPFHEDDMPSCLKAWAHSLETGEPYAVEYRCRRYDGAWRWMLGRALPYRDSDGKIQGWFGTCTDFDELYHMREQLRSTLQQNAAVLAGAGCLLIAVDLAKRITFLEGSEKDEIIADAGIDAPVEGKPFALLRPSETFVKSVDEVLTGKGERGRVEGFEQRGRTYRCLLTPLTQTRIDGSVHTVGCIIVAHNITDLVQTQQQLRQSFEERAKLQASETAATEASRLKSEFLALTSHELRTPISHMLGLGELLLAEPLNDNSKNLASQILRSGDVLLEMIGQVLDMGKVEAGKLDLETRPFDLNDLSSDARFFSTAASKKGLKFVEEIDVFGAQVLGDMPRIRQVITNILSNAVKFTSNGSITLRIKKVEEDDKSIAVKWQVQDTGVGIREDAISSLFKPFHQADGSISRRFGGTGLGLSISKNLIELMGGSINLESEYGKGTTMTAELKLEKAPVELVEVAPATPNPAQQQQQQDIDRSEHTILVVDDNELNRNIITRLLSKMGFMSDSASSGYEALDKVADPEKKRYSLILMDHQMDGMDGLETTIRIRGDKNPLIASIKIIALTASALKGDQEMFLANGADGYLSKPVRSAVLENTIVRALLPAGTATRRSSGTATPGVEKSGFDFGSFNPTSPTSESDADLGDFPRRRPSHPSYGEGTV